MRIAPYISTALLMLYMAQPGQSQQVTVVNHYHGDTAGVGAQDFILAGSTEHRYIVNHYTVRAVKPEERVMDLVDYSLSFYLDEMLDWSTGKVQFKRSRDEDFARINELVQHVLGFYQHPASEAFWGFSGRLEKQLHALHSLSGRDIDYQQPTSPATGTRVGHYTLQRQLIDFKGLAYRELEEVLEDHPAPIDMHGRLLTTAEPEPKDRSEQLMARVERSNKQEVMMLIDSLFELPEAPHHLIAAINQRIAKLDSPPEPVFRKNQQIPPMEFGVEPEYVPEPPPLKLDLKQPAATAAVEPAQRDFNERILTLLEQNNRLMEKYNDRFEDMQSQINELRTQPAAQRESEARLQQQIDEIHQMISELKTGAESGSSSARKLQPVALIFERNSAELTLQHQVIMNEIVAGLMRNRNYKVMITGFADRTGNPEHNILLSRMRAQRVRDYIALSGIDNSRMVLNYLGDNKSQEPNPLDRKVEIEFLIDFTAADSTTNR
ncbi:MAG: hypothetical protein EA392_02600 [Cryomorphaceae bacterium]|nr:MAG: hypothetical protein EA392_02600 [Cryomorphaceae bacterium]